MTQKKTITLVDLTYGGSHNVSYLLSYAIMCKSIGFEPTIIANSWVVKDLRCALEGSSVAGCAVINENSYRLPSLIFRFCRRIECWLAFWKRPIEGCCETPKLGQVPSEALSIWILIFLFRVLGIVSNESPLIFLSAEQMLCSKHGFWAIIRPRRWACLLIGTSWLRLARDSTPYAVDKLTIADPSCTAIGCLTDFDAEIARSCVPDETRVSILPEAVNLLIPQHPLNPNVRRAVELSEARAIVLLTGVLSSRKCVHEILEAWDRVPANCFLIIAGKLSPNAFPAGEYNLIRTKLAKSNRIFAISEWIESEQDLNWMVSKSALVAVMYRDFQGSSNIFAKAVALRKPSLALASTEVGRRVCKYDLGVTALDLTAEEIATKIAIGVTQNVRPDGYLRYEKDFGSSAVIEKWISKVGIAS